MDIGDVLIKDNIYIKTDVNELSNIVEDNTSAILLGYSNIDILSGIDGKLDKILFITKEDLKIEKENVIVKNKITKSIIKKTKKIIVCINLDDNYENAKYIVKSLIRLKNISELYKVKFGCNQEDNIFIGMINNNESKYFDDIINAIKAMYIDNIEERLNYVYDKACDYLDNQFKENNYCEFHDDDTCIANRSGTAAHSEMGCCYSFKYGSLFSIELIQNVGICKYLDCKTCSAKSISCKMFTCKELKKEGIEYNCKNILLLDCFFNKKQHLVLESNYFKTKEEIIKKILEEDHYPYPLYYVSGKYYIY